MNNKKQSTGRAVAAASIGNALEWYDFSVYAFFATYIGHGFFLEGDETSALIKTFLVFAAGFIARPLGAVYLGLYGDRKGRKAALTLTIAMMAIGTGIIAFAPTVAAIGIGAPILLFIGRVCQGFSAGGEIGGATAFLVESAPKNKKNLYASWLQASMGISNIIAAVVGVTVTSIFDEPTIQAWAWRIPFIVGLLIVPVGFYIRSHVDETDDFEHMKTLHPKEKVTFGYIVKNYPLHLLWGFMFSILWTACVYTLIIYMPTYYKTPISGLGFSSNDAFTASLIGNVFMVIVCLIAGRIADKIGLRKVLTVSIILLAIGSYPLLGWLHGSPTLTNLIIVHICFCSMVALFAGCAPSALARLYPVAVRSTGMSLSYNAAAIFFAGFTPAILTWASSKLDRMAPSVYLSITCVIAFIGMHFLFKYAKRSDEYQEKEDLEYEHLIHQEA